MAKSRRGWLIGGGVLAVALALLLLWRARWSESEVSEPNKPETSAGSGTAPVAPVPPTPPVASRDGAAGRSLELVPATVSADPDAANGLFSGRVIDWGTGHGVAGAEVAFEGPQGATSVRTGADGQFRFEPPEAGNFRLAVAHADGYLPYAPQWGQSRIELVARPRVRIDGIVVYLSPAVDYTGVVVDEDGKPVAGAAVRFLDARIDERALMPVADQRVTDDDGKFVFHAPDWSVVQVTRDGYLPGRGRVDRDVQITHRLEIQLRKGDAAAADQASVIAGVVVDGAGQPVADAWVLAYPISGDRERAAWAPQAMSGPDGRFEIELLDAGTHRVQATHAEMAPDAVEVEPGDRSVELTLGQTATIRGRVVAGGEPVPAFTVAVLVRDRRITEDLRSYASFFDGQGQFEISGLPARSYILRAAAHGYALSDPVEAEAVVDAADVSEVEISLRRGGTLVGTVIDSETRKPLEKARVVAEGSIGVGSSALPMLTSATTDSSGRFELSGLVPGQRSVIASAANHHQRILSGLAVADGARLGPVEMALSPLAPGEKPQIELAGIGCQLKAVDDGLVIEKVIEGGGAEEAGLVAGDVILKVEGQSVVDLGFQGTIEKIRGPEGSPVVLTVRRADGSEIDVTATRRKIRA